MNKVFLVLCAIKSTWRNCIHFIISLLGLLILFVCSCFILKNGVWYRDQANIKFMVLLTQAIEC